MLERMEDRKDKVRRAVLARRTSISSAQAEAAGRAVALSVSGLPEIGRAQHVMVYLTYKSEVPTESVIEVLRRAGKTLYAPRIDPDSGLLLAAYLPPDAELRLGPYDVPEPVGTECIAAQRLDAVIAPGVAFDECGRRLGFGKGYYDRFLGMLRPSACKIGLAYDVQLVPEVPAGPGDVAMDIIVTERRVIRPPAPGLQRRCQP